MFGVEKGQIMEFDRIVVNSQMKSGKVHEEILGYRVCIEKGTPIYISEEVMKLSGKAEQFLKCVTNTPQRITDRSLGVEDYFRGIAERDLYGWVYHTCVTVIR
jgi:hypothetical protein